MYLIPVRYLVTVAFVAVLLSGCASLKSTLIPVEVEPSPFGEHVPAGYVPEIAKTSRNQRLAVTYLTWDWRQGTAPAGPESLVLLSDLETNQHFELTEFRGKNVRGLFWQPDRRLRVEIRGGPIWLELDEAGMGHEPPQIVRTQSRPSRSTSVAYAGW